MSRSFFSKTSVMASLGIVCGLVVLGVLASVTFATHGQLTPATYGPAASVYNSSQNGSFFGSGSPSPSHALFPASPFSFLIIIGVLLAISVGVALGATFIVSRKVSSTKTN